MKPGDTEDFEIFIRDRYLPAVSGQTGFQRGHLVRSFGDDYLAAIEATSDGFAYRLEFGFSSEEERLSWVQSPIHGTLWPAFQKYCDRWRYCGYDVMYATSD